jgi:hypothetical protein
MRVILHIIAGADDALAQEIIARQIKQPDLKVEVMDLTQTEPNYQVLLEKIFAADSVESW